MNTSEFKNQIEKLATPTDCNKMKTNLLMGRIDVPVKQWNEFADLIDDKKSRLFDEMFDRMMQNPI